VRSVAADSERGNWGGPLEVEVSAVLAGEAHEPWAGDGERHAFEIALRQVRPRLQDPLVGRPARPVHLVVDPRRQAESVRLLDPEPDPLEVPLPEVRHLEAVPAVEHHAVHPLVPELPELEPHLVRIEFAVQEPEGEDPEVPIGGSKRLAIQGARGVHGITVAFTNPSGLSTATLNAASISAKG